MSITQVRPTTAAPDVSQDPDRIPKEKVVLDATHVVAAFLRRIFRTPRWGARRPREYRLPHYNYLEYSRMSREMERL